MIGGLRRFRSLRDDVRGATAVLFGVSAVVIVGMVGLGTEGGSWYLTRRDAQNAADPGAYAGAVRLSLAQSTLGLTLTAARTQADSAARDNATMNGFTNAAAATVVTVNSPPATGPNSGNQTAVEVIVERTRPRLISALFLTTDPVITARGVAALLPNGAACMLAIPGFGTGTVTGQLLAGGSSTISAPNCILGSNSALDNSISITGAASVTALSLTTTGGCNGCDAATLTQPVTSYAPPTVNPLQFLNTKVLPSFSSSDCYQSPVYAPDGALIAGGIPSNGKVNTSMVIPPPPSGKAICGLDISGAGTVVTLNPGTYYFYNSSFKVTSGKVECRMPTVPPTADGDVCAEGHGVTLVFTGSPAQIGGPNINGNANITLSAPTAAHAADPDYAGILFFRDPRATGGNNQGNPAVDINGGPSTSLTGAMYFPNSYVKYSGNAAVNTCSVLIGGTVEMTGNTGVTLNECVALGYGNLVPNLQIVRLVE
ncbi:pilus assembly protein TadG-related protein [Falsiroseomonas sp. E2-1-a4]|uniref:pilus assembly protein TadG-related protein n=1 Tax=Falsiroseomonas sp. E2-1-a4 TaxID=3239299 RepID=UPI003F5A7318